MDDRYWGYWVNNDVFYHPTDFNLNSHIVPPATEVVPLGNPSAAAMGGKQHRRAARPLVTVRGTAGPTVHFVRAAGAGAGAGARAGRGNARFPNGDCPPAPAAMT